MSSRADRLQDLYGQSRHATEKSVQYKKKIQELSTEIDDLKKRLSRVMSSNLTDNNPDIADLSDENRPTKLAERYTELYDNEWSDAFEWLGSASDKTDDEIVQNLLNILQDIYNICRVEATRQLETLENDIVKFLGDQQLTDLVRALMKEMKDKRKKYCKQAPVDLLEEANAMASSYIPNFNDPGCGVTEYVCTATHLCWLMAIQDPPVHMDTRPTHGDRFNKQVYREYTFSGKIVEYVVWPPLYVSEGGALLTKGVAQPAPVMKLIEVPNASQLTKGVAQPAPVMKPTEVPNSSQTNPITTEEGSRTTKSDNKPEKPCNYNEEIRSDTTSEQAQSLIESADEQGPANHQSESAIITPENGKKKYDEATGLPNLVKPAIHQISDQSSQPDSNLPSQGNAEAGSHLRIKHMIDQQVIQINNVRSIGEVDNQRKDIKDEAERLNQAYNETTLQNVNLGDTTKVGTNKKSGLMKRKPSATRRNTDKSTVQPKSTQLNYQRISLSARKKERIQGELNALVPSNDIV